MTVILEVMLSLLEDLQGEHLKQTQHGLDNSGFNGLKAGCLNESD